MRLGMAKKDDRAMLFAASGEDMIDLSHCGPWKTVVDAIENWEECRPVFSQAIADRKTTMVGSVEWLPPIGSPPKFLLLAGNFRKHVLESGFATLPEGNLTPQFFSKPSTAIIGCFDAIPITDRNVALDYEAELAVVVGSRLKNGNAEEAMRAVWGFTVVNDVSERRLNSTAERTKRDNDDFFDWLVGKWLDGSAPMGPYVVTADEILDSSRLVIRAFLNGEKVQEGRASEMVHGIGEALSYISSILTLEPGDVISMGTPDGVGMGRGRLLKHEDLIECEIEGIGRLSNRVSKR
jgi:2-keto-4-pentenoate hydratase/2-oxohepta-3-ene-1,7-dioic acid hydratase in catechol pathway